MVTLRLSPWPADALLDFDLSRVFPPATMERLSSPLLSCLAHRPRRLPCVNRLTALQSVARRGGGFLSLESAFPF